MNFFVDKRTDEGYWVLNIIGPHTNEHGPTCEHIDKCTCLSRFVLLNSSDYEKIVDAIGFETPETLQSGDLFQIIRFILTHQIGLILCEKHMLYKIDSIVTNNNDGAGIIAQIFEGINLEPTQALSMKIT